MLIYYPIRPKELVKQDRAILERVRAALPGLGYEVRELQYDVPSGNLFGGRQSKEWAILIVPSRSSASDASAASVGVLWVIFGGNAMTSSDWLPFVEALLRDRTTMANDQQGRRPPGFLLVDYPGYGRNEGQPSTSAALRSAETGVRAAVEALGAEPGARPEGLAFLGHSLGAAAALQLAARLAARRPPWLGAAAPAARLVLSAPFTSMPGMGLVLFGEVPGARLIISILRLTSRHAWDNEQSIRQLGAAVAAGCPPPVVTFLHGHRDELVPFHMSQALYRLCGELRLRNCQLLERPHAGHNDILDEAFQEYARLILGDDPPAGRL